MLEKVFQWKRGGLLFPQMPVCNQHTLSRYVLLSKARVFYLFSNNNSMTNPSFSQIVPNFCSETTVRGKTVLLTLLKSEPSIASNWRCVPALRNHICHTTKEINFQKLKGKIKLSQIKMWVTWRHDEERCFNQKLIYKTILTQELTENTHCDTLWFIWVGEPGPSLILMGGQSNQTL